MNLTEMIEYADALQPHKEFIKTNISCFYEIKARHLPTGKKYVLFYEIRPCDTRIKQHFADYIGDDSPDDWEIIDYNLQFGICSVSIAIYSFLRSIIW